MSSRARRRTRGGVLAAVVLAAAVLAPAAGAAVVTQVPGRGLVGLHDARYCEILELRGGPPTGTVNVFNTIGLNACPPAQWMFDAPSLATELGATLVILNGPRHFLMDEVKGTVGPARSFHGLKMRKAATITIKTADQLVVRAFTDRTIARDNIWRWNKGRKVYELVAPGGDTYVMQSYSLIKDPSLTLAKLAKLGPRLGLPDGWRYRTRVLRKPLALVARGSATITQDELGNTYQLASTVRDAPRKTREVRVSGRTATVPSRTPGTVEDHGSVTGTPFGDGRLVLVGVFGANSTMTATVRLSFPTGSIVVSTALPYTISDGKIHFRGTSQIINGTGVFRGITGPPLQTVDDNTLDGQNGVVSVTGRVTY